MTCRSLLRDMPQLASFSLNIPHFSLLDGAGGWGWGLGPGLGAWLSRSSLLPATSLRWLAPPARALRQKDTKIQTQRHFAWWTVFGTQKTQRNTVFLDTKVVRFVTPSMPQLLKSGLDPKKLGFEAYRKIMLPALPQRRYLHRHPGYQILKYAWNNF